MFNSHACHFQLLNKVPFDCHFNRMPYANPQNLWNYRRKIIWNISRNLPEAEIYVFKKGTIPIFLHNSVIICKFLNHIAIIAKLYLVLLLCQALCRHFHGLTSITLLKPSQIIIVYYRWRNRDGKLNNLSRLYSL